MNKIERKAESKQDIPEVKGSIKISSYAMKESKEVEKKGEPLMKASMKKSLKKSINLKNSLVDDF